MVKYFLTKNFSNRKKDNQYSFYMLNIQQYNQPQLHLTTIPIDYLYRQQRKRLSQQVLQRNPLLKSPTPPEDERKLFHTESLLPPRDTREKQRDAPYKCYLNNCTIVSLNSQYNMAIYLNLYIHTIVYDRDYYIGSIIPWKT